ncbi:MAG: TIGR01777 family oxidoreductase [Flavobacteriales bacterium]|nr:TIGR01777 family oxidoreductase [Flavobacteriales bacterium]
MNITIAGGTGFLGRELEKHLSNKGHQITILTRRPSDSNHIRWEGIISGTWPDQISQTDVLINLCGRSVDCRYTDLNKKEIIASRVEPTLAFHKAIQDEKIKPKIWLNASSATIYTHAESLLMDEQNGVIGDDFSMIVCKEWERSFFTHFYSDTRQVALRTSIVLGSTGGAFSKLKPVTRLGLGGKQGHGNQMVSWIHIDDFCRSIDHIIQDGHISGPINLTSPNPVDNDQFMKAVRSTLKIPFGIPQPKWLLEFGAALIGTETELLLKSRNVFPRRLLESGFSFSYGTLKECINGLR